MKRRIVAALLAAAMGVTMLAGCGQKEDTKAEAKTEWKDADYSGEDPQLEKKVKILSIWAEDNDNGILLNKICEDYKQNVNPNFEWEYEMVSADNLTQRIATLAASNDLPDLFAYEAGAPLTTLSLQKEFAVTEPLLYTIVLGHSGAAPATPEALMAMCQFLPAGALWGITHAYRQDFGIIGAALGLGASTVRVGFEDSAYLTPTQTVSQNVPLVEKTAALIRAMDKEVMTPTQARASFHLGV
ncbi:3-keto-5-aminohexanoate cleavage protein [Ohessyouella blattaphilus]|uniref:3-keto-5-aminohexanoate cleavage protein n=1 Tax=Ohessyouella blattaphilus TaxID=2949333 RepID=A0ABT1EIR5_9FIRM|nr:3-keto-5-aminohexanoate cleavage protein [Ohessyouella blattaphilus]MCP1110359.1 3-keto-5-aminohexanoate cleavage protein [Ohessyouella blattaphilus]MCR8563753.1 3-keto-5-aminohexanoate cleavage protein [Ohessyouella blattaphilus]